MRHKPGWTRGGIPLLARADTPRGAEPSVSVSTVAYWLPTNKILPIMQFYPLPVLNGVWQPLQQNATPLTTNTGKTAVKQPQHDKKIPQNNPSKKASEKTCTAGTDKIKETIQQTGKPTKRQKQNEYKKLLRTRLFNEGKPRETVINTQKD